MSGSFEDELKETDETLTEEFTCIVTLISLFVVDSYLEDVLCAACRRCVELFKFNTESTALGYARGAEMARLVPLGRSKARELLEEGAPRWVHAVSITARQLLEADGKMH